MPVRTHRPRLLDLFCGAGGTSAGYHAAGFDVTGVDIEPQPHYPFPFIRADAFTVELSGFDVVAASPPCQRYSYATPTSRRSTHPDLLDPVRRRLLQAVDTGSTRAYVIENVPGAVMRDPVTICGDSLRLGVRRHRLFESNLHLAGTSCWHDLPAPPVAVYGTYGQRGRRKPVDGETSHLSTEHARQAMGIDWMPWPALTQAIPPAYTWWIGVQLLTRLPPVRDASTAVQTSLPPETPDGDETRRRETSQDGQGASVTPAPGFRHCRCGCPLHRPETGRWPRHCSHACRQAAYRNRVRVGATS